jgi:DNA repair exonuclease SbcCD ATPase subunit
MNLDLEDIKSRALYQQGGPNPAQVLIHESDFNYLLIEVNRLRKDCEHHKQAALDISEENDRLVQDMADQEDAAATWDQVEAILDGFTVDPPRPGAKRVQDLFDVINRLQNENAFQNQRMQELFQKAERLEKLVPPETERGPGFVGQGTWSVFAEKVTEERDAARAEVVGLCKGIRGLEDKISELDEDNWRLQDKVKRLEERLAAKKEHSSIDTDGDEIHAISGYGSFRLTRTTADSQWSLTLNEDKVVLYNRKGRRVRAKLADW